WKTAVEPRRVHAAHGGLRAGAPTVANSAAKLADNHHYAGASLEYRPRRQPPWRVLDDLAKPADQKAGRSSPSEPGQASGHVPSCDLAGLTRLCGWPAPCRGP